MHAKHQQDAERELFRDQRPRSFEDLYNPKEVIELKQLFPNDSKEKAPQHQLLILGRAGIGKTTLCKYIAYQWAYHQLWQDKFDWLFWIPLNRLHATYYQKHSLTLATVIHRECFQDTPDLKKQEIDHWLQSEKVLLLLDGYDEIEFQMNEDLTIFIETLLNHKDVILTSRPYASLKLAHGYTRLENIGFLDNDIEDYIQKFFTHIEQPHQKEAFWRFTKQHPSVWGAAHIPINLELICSTWDDKQKNSQVFNEPLTMTSLYEELIYKLCKRYLMKRKHNPLTEEELSAWDQFEVEQECQSVIDFLSTLAMHGLTHPRKGSLIDNQTLRRVRKPLKVSAELFDDILMAGFLKGIGNQTQIADQSYYFLHWTLQDFFAARYLASWFKEENETKRIFYDVKYPNISAFIAKYRKETFYEIMLSFAAGLLSKDQKHIEDYFTLLTEESSEENFTRETEENLSLFLTTLRSLEEASIPKTRHTKRLLIFYQDFADRILLRDTSIKRKGNNAPSLFLISASQKLGAENIATDTIYLQLKKQRIKASFIKEGCLQHTWIEPDQAEYEYINENLAELEYLSYLSAPRVKMTVTGSKAWVEKVLTHCGHLPEVSQKHWLAPLEVTQRFIACLKACPQVMKASNISQLLQEAVQKNLYITSTMPTPLKPHAYVLLKEAQAKPWQLFYAKREDIARSKQILLQPLYFTQIAGLEALQFLSNNRQPESLTTEERKAIKDIIVSYPGSSYHVNQVAKTLAFFALIDLETDPSVFPTLLLKRLNKGKLSLSMRDKILNLLGERNLWSEEVTYLLQQQFKTFPPLRPTIVKVASLLFKNDRNLIDILFQALTSSTQDENLRYQVIRQLRKILLQKASVVGGQPIVETDKMKQRIIESLVLVAEQIFAKLFTVIDCPACTLEELAGLPAQVGGEYHLLNYIVEILLSYQNHVANENDREYVLQRITLFEQALPERMISVCLGQLSINDAVMRERAIRLLGLLGKPREDIIEGITKALADKERQVRVSAIQALGELNRIDRSLVDILIKLESVDKIVKIKATEELIQSKRTSRYVWQTLVRNLSSKLPEVRRSIIKALIHLGDGNEVIIRALVKSLTDENSGVRKQAIEALEKLGKGDEDAIQGLMKSLINGNENIRRAAVEALGKLGKADKSVILTLVKCLGDPAWSVREAAAEALGELGKTDDSRIQALVWCLADQNADVRRAAIEALGKLGKVDEFVLQALVKCLGDLNEYIIRAAIGVLGKLGKADEPVIEALVRCLGHQNENVRRAAAGALGTSNIAEKLLFKALVRGLADQNADVRRATAEVLGKLGKADKMVIRALVKCLGNPPWSVREAAIEALGKLGKADELVLQALVKCLDVREDYYIRRAAIEALGKLRKADKLVLQALVQCLDDQEEYLRKAAAEVLGKLGEADESVIQALVKCLGDPHDYVRGVAAGALGRLGKANELVIQGLLKCLDDEYKYVRRAAAEVLGKLGKADELVIQGLMRCMHDQDEIVRRVADEALEKLGKTNKLPIQAIKRLEDVGKIKLINSTFLYSKPDGSSIDILSSFKEARDEHSSFSNLPLQQPFSYVGPLPLSSEEEFTKITWQKEKSSISSIAAAYKGDFINTRRGKSIVITLAYTCESEAWNSLPIVKSILEELKGYLEAAAIDLLQGIRIANVYKGEQLTLLINCKYESYAIFMQELLQEAAFNFAITEEDKGVPEDNYKLGFGL